MVNLKPCVKWSLAWLSFSWPPVLLGDQAGDFDYYILALSWRAGWCEVEGRERNAPQCAENAEGGFTLHGLWPQYDEGWPSYCSTTEPNPSRRDTANMAWLYGSSGAAWHQWDKHGRCTGMGFDEYYERSAELTERFSTPEILMSVDEVLNVAPEAIEEAMEDTHHELQNDEMAVICRDGVFVELRICLDQDFEPQECLGSAARDCNYSPELIPSF